MPTYNTENNVSKPCTCDFVTMCVRADSLMQTQSVAMQMMLNITKVQ